MKHHTLVNVKELTDSRISQEVSVVEGQLKYFNSQLKKPTLRESFDAIQYQVRVKLSRLWELKKELSVRGGAHA